VDVKQDEKRHRLRLHATVTDCGIEVGRFVPDVAGGTLGRAGGLRVSRTADVITCGRCIRAQP
jgi:hypothetical protein